MAALAPDPSPPAPTLTSTPMAGRTPRPKPSAASVAAAVGGFAVSLIGHSAFLVWGIGVWDMATPLSAAPPPSVMVDLVDDPWKSKPPPESGPGGQPGDMPAPPPPAAAPLPPPSAAAPSPPQAPVPWSQSSGRTAMTTSRPGASPSPPAPAAAPPPPPPAAPFAFPSFDASEAAMVEPGTPTGLRIAQMLQVPVELPVDAPEQNLGGGGAADIGVDLGRTLINEFKDHVQTCWKAPPEAVGDERIKVLIRVGLRPDGSLVGEPTLVQAVATPSGPAMVKSAIAAVRNCQPYAFLPADQYKEWRAVDIAFSAKGVL
jgi:hypothetical protein